MTSLYPTKTLNYPQKDTYCLDIKVCRDNNSLFAVSGSDNNVLVYDINTQQQTTISLSNQNESVNSISCIVYDSPNLLFVGSMEVPGGVVCFDLRTKEQRVFKVGNGALCMSLNSTGTMLATGTACQYDESKIMFWDLRATSEPIEFTECHSDDITQVKFHPIQPALLSTGSTDAVVNLFDLKLWDEEESLHQTIKSNSCQKISYFGTSMENIAVVSHMETLSLYEFETGNVIKEYGDMRDEFRDKGPMDYLIDCEFDSNHGEHYLYTGDQSGNVGVWRVGGNDIGLKVVLRGATDIVRGVQSISCENVLLTCGEDGLICIYKNEV